MASGFEGMLWLPVVELGLSQIYLSERKLRAIEDWFTPEALAAQPLPVHDFGDGRYTLTDGHTRAFCAWKSGMEKVPVIYDRDDIIVLPQGQMLYREDIRWCQRFGLRGVMDLAERILSEEDYRRLWLDRCDAGYHLLTQTSPEERVQLAQLQPQLYLFGASEDMTTLYFETLQGEIVCHPNPIKDDGR